MLLRAMSLLANPCERVVDGRRSFGLDAAELERRPDAMRIALIADLEYSWRTHRAASFGVAGGEAASGVK